MIGDDLNALFALAKPITLAMPRLAAVLLVFPLVPTSLFPAMLRNGLVVALALPLYPLMLASVPDEPASAAAWVPYLLKEFAIGATIGWMFACLIWAFQIMGDVLDAQAGTGFSAMFDPMSGSQTAVFATFLRQFAVVAFLLVGGLFVMLNVVYDSFIVWPIGGTLPLSPARMFDAFLSQTVTMFSLALSLVLPLAFLLLILELAVALISRSFPQMNVFTLSMPVKMLAAILGLVLVMTYLTERLAAQIRSAWALF